MSAERGGKGTGRDRTPLARRFTLRYWVAIGAFALVALVGTMLSAGTLDDIEQTDQRLVAAAEQPVRVQRIVELGRALDEAGMEPVDLRAMQDASVGLQNEATDLRSTQAALLGGNDALGLDESELSPQLRELYLGSGQLDQRVSSFASTAELLARFSAPDEAGNRADPLAQLVEQHDRLSADLAGAVELYAEENADALARQRDRNVMVLALGVAVAAATVLTLFRPMARKIQRETSQLEAAERSHRENNERQTFRNELSKALEVCTDEDEVLEASARGLATAAATPAEVLMIADERTHLVRRAQHPEVGPAGCPVDDPHGCAALRAGQTMVYESSRMLNVCPKLPQHDRGPCSAVCVPMVFNGEALGVLHAVAEENHVLGTTMAERLKALAEETSTRLGTLRITKATERLAASDVLTDLDNRRTLLARAADLIEHDRSFSVAVADLDHFKDLNDTYGHETGDRALQLFADCLRKQLRPEDVIARYGGEEFVVILPDTPVEAAARTIDRLRGGLAEEIRTRNSVPFTASWGVTDHTAGDSFQSMLNVADLAMYEAKRTGRNRVVVARPPAPGDGAAPAPAAGPPPATEPTGGEPAPPPPT